MKSDRDAVQKFSTLQHAQKSEESEIVMAGESQKIFERSIATNQSKQCNGRNSITEKTRELVKICGCENWEECTNHGLRAMGVTILHNSNKINLTNKPVLTHSRHPSEKSQNPYNRDIRIANSNLQDALIGDVAKKSSATPLDTELSVLKKIVDELKNENELLRVQLNRKNY